MHACAPLQPHDTAPTETHGTNAISSLRKVGAQLLTKSPVSQPVLCTIPSGRVDQLTNNKAVIHT